MTGDSQNRKQPNLWPIESKKREKEKHVEKKLKPPQKDMKNFIKNDFFIINFWILYNII